MRVNKEIICPLLAVLPVFITQFIIGGAYSWTAYNIKYLLSSDSDIPLTQEQSSLVVSLLHVGRTIGPMLAIVLAGKLGRKFQLIVSSICILCSSILIAATRSVFLLFVARFICGYAAGTSAGVTWTYIGEVTSGRIRGIFCSISLVCFYVGITFQFLIGPILTYQQASILWICVACSLLFSLFITVETPYYLLSRGRNQEALNVLSWLRAVPKENLVLELINMEEHMLESTGFKEFINLFKRPEVYKSFIINLTFAIVCSTVAVQLNAYATFIFPKSDILSSDNFSVFFGVIQLLSSIASCGVIKNFGRKRILVVTYITEAILLFTTTVLIYMKENSFDIPCYAWFIFITVSGYMLLYSIGTLPAVASLRAELFPTVVKELGSNMVVIVNSAVNSMFSYIFFAIKKKFGMHVNFFIFFLSCVLGALFSVYVVPETKDKSLEEIQDMLDNKKDRDSLKK